MRKLRISLNADSSETVRFHPQYLSLRQEVAVQLQVSGDLRQLRIDVGILLDLVLDHRQVRGNASLRQIDGDIQLGIVPINAQLAHLLLPRLQVEPALFLRQFELLSNGRYPDAVEGLGRMFGSSLRLG